MRGIWGVLVITACSSPSGPALTFDACQSTTIGVAAASDDQLASIDDAIAMWSAEGVTLARGDTGEVTIVFRPASDAFYGFYDDTTATVYINVDVTDRAQRAIVLAHEIGHALGLVHISPSSRASVMNPGNVTIAPNDGDRAALAALWGSCTR